MARQRAVVTVLTSFATALLAAGLAMWGNYVLVNHQTRAKVAEERRAFVRELHDSTVLLGVDLELFCRSLRADVVGGSRDEARAQRVIDEQWEGDLLRRVRRVSYGHPDPDVREAAEAVDYEMWVFMVAATTADPPSARSFHPGYTTEERREAAFRMDDLLKELRRAIYVAPNRDVPAEIRYDGSFRLPGWPGAQDDQG